MVELRESGTSDRSGGGANLPTVRRTFSLLSGVATLIFLIVPAGAAEASVIAYSTQSGSVSASGSTAIESGSDTQPFSGLAPVDVSASYEQNVGGSPFAEAHAALQTMLAASAITISGATDASAAPQCCLDPDYSQAWANADVDIEFTLTEDSTLNVAYTAAEVFNGPLVTLEHLTIGFAIQYAYWYEASMASCGSLTPEECDAILYGLIIPTMDDPVLPAGDYRLSYSLFAFQPQGSCGTGCNTQDGDVTFTFTGTGTGGAPPVPSLGPWALLTLGVALVHLARRPESSPEPSG